MSDLFKRATWPWKSGLWYAKVANDFSRRWRIEMKRRARRRLKRWLRLGEERDGIPEDS
jgi:hypothetical protein